MNISHVHWRGFVLFIQLNRLCVIHKFICQNSENFSGCYPWFLSLIFLTVIDVLKYRRSDWIQMIWLYLGKFESSFQELWKSTYIKSACGHVIFFFCLFFLSVRWDLSIKCVGLQKSWCEWYAVWTDCLETGGWPLLPGWSVWLQFDHILFVLC